jgi:hypothetical protein
MDPLGEFVGTASIDGVSCACAPSATANICSGQVVIHSLNTPESYSFDHKRPMRSIALEPNFSKRGTRSFVCGGLAGNLILHEKGWLGHKETTLHNGEGPIWQIRWRGTLIAWANDLVSKRCRCTNSRLTPSIRASKYMIQHPHRESRSSIDPQTLLVLTCSGAICTGKTILLS